MPRPSRRLVLPQMQKILAVLPPLTSCVCKHRVSARACVCACLTRYLRRHAEAKGETSTEKGRLGRTRLEMLRTMVTNRHKYH